VVARLHGDEFAVLLPGADRATAETVAAALVTLIREYASGVGCERAQVTASVGVALFGGLTESETVALANMDKQTIAEYVTDAETSALLLAAGVDYAQGFHIGRPGPIEGVLASQYGP
jgi:GGDEF domain-containing protein